MEAIFKSPKILKENHSKERNTIKSFTEKYFERLSNDENILNEIVDFNGKNATMEDKIRQVCSTIDELVNEEEIERENIINEAMSALSIDDKNDELL
jgi:hypothetical protein